MSDQSNPQVKLGPEKRLYSVYADPIKQLITLKRQLGYKYVTGAVILAQIDKFALQRNEESPGITKEFADLWGQKRPEESSHYHYGRIRHLAQLSSLLLDNGIASYVPKLPPYPKERFIPYIFSPKEIQSLFRAIDSLELTQVAKGSSLVCIPPIIRMLYATGLRIGEVVSLKQTDIDLEKQYVKVTDSKNGKQRIIPIDKSLVQVCQTYQNYIRQIRNHTPSEYFFIRPNGYPCNTNSIRTWFRKSLRIAGITCKAGAKNRKRNLPRIHDLRHTFAVTALASMAQAGLDLYVSLPILSNYLGHQSIQATDHYVRLTQSHYPDLLQKAELLYLDVFPSFSHYEQQQTSQNHQNEQ